MKEILEKVTTEATATDFWIKDSKINKLLKEAEEIRMNGNGNLEIVSNNNLLEIRLGTSVFRSSKKENYEEFSHAQIISVLKGIQEIYKVDKTKNSCEKSCVIL